MPVYVALPAELTATEPCPVLPAGPASVESLITLADARGAACKAYKGQLEAIRALQPKED